VSASIVRIAPPAKERTKATAPSEAESNSAKPARAARPEHERDAEPEREDVRPRPARAEQAAARRQCLGDVRERDRDEEGGAHAALDDDGQAEHERLRDAVEDGSEDDRERRALRLLATRMLPVGASPAVDEQIAGPERRGAGEQPERDAGSPSVPVPGFVDELEGDGADQHAAAEGHDEAERPFADAPAERHDAAHDECRGGEKSPSERSRHDASLRVLPASRIARSG